MDFHAMLADIRTFATAAAANGMAQGGLKVVGIILAAILTQRFAHRAVERMVRRAITTQAFASTEAERKREDTLIHVLDGAIRFLAWFVAAFFLLTTLGVTTTPFVTAAGVVGLALSIGGQHVTRDFIVGVWMTIEDQYRVGDAVRINGISGVVKDMTLRVTVLRDDDGALHYVQHGLITSVMNLREKTAAPPRIRMT